MSILTESLKRLYTAGKVSLEKLQEMMSTNKISLEEYRYIIG